MADDLLDDWWVKEDIEDGGFCGYIIDTKGSDENIVTSKKKKKKKPKLDDVALENNEENIVTSNKKEKQKHTLDDAAVENNEENIVTSKKKEKQKHTSDDAAVENNEENIVISKKKKTKKRTLDEVPVDNNTEDEISFKNKKKTKHHVNDTKVCNNTEDIKPVLTKKKKRKKRKINSVDDYQPTFEALLKFFETELQKTLSAIEIEDIKPDNDDWYLSESELIKKDNVNNFPLYLKNVVPDWEESCAKLTKKELKASPIMLIMTSSAQRAVDLLRYTSSFKGEKCRTVKLFAKHFKVDDQVKHLEENIVHLAVGTPHRILTLLENGGLKVKHLKYVIVDWSWKDVKTRRIVNMPDVKDDFVLLFQKHLFSQCQKGTLSVGLF